MAKGAALLCLATQALSILGPLLFVVPGCNESNIAGVTKEYPALGYDMFRYKVYNIV